MTGSKELEKTKEFESLDDIEKENAGFIVTFFGQYMYQYYLQRPDTWSVNALEDVIIDIFPSKITADEDTFNSVEAILTVYLQYLKENKYINNADELINKLKEVSPIMVKEAKNSRNWGIAKQLAMIQMGYVSEEHFSNEEDQYAKKGISIKAEPKIGRNDPCPCGSGKKYKKCCGKK